MDGFIFFKIFKNSSKLSKFRNILSFSFITILLLLCIIILCCIIYNLTDNQYKENFETPKILIQTIRDKSVIPDKVYKNIKKFAPEYKHIIYDDSECIQFLKKYNHILHKKANLVDVFRKIPSGAHKADLFRYCYLYINGGVYLDIKIELIKPLREIFKNPNVLYTNIAANNTSIFQAIIHSPKNNPIFLDLIDYIANNYNNSTKINDFCTKDFYNKVCKYTNKKKLKEGYHKNIKKGPNIYLFREIGFDNSDCYDGYDRYGGCYFIVSKGKKIIKCRYSDYGKKWI